MWKKAKDLTGKTFGKLTVVKRNGTKNGKSVWECRCECGTIKNVTASDLTTGNTQSCGCQRMANTVKASTKHGCSHERLYRIYIAMKTRCRNNPYYKAISVCKEWLESYQAFKEWAMANGYADNLTIDRINNEGNYEPSNCRWITMKEQSKNRRKRGTALWQQ